MLRAIGTARRAVGLAHMHTAQDADVAIMQQLLQLAASAHNAVPIAAGVVKGGNLIATGVNSNASTLHHAEMLAMQVCFEVLYCC